MKAQLQKWLSSRLLPVTVLTEEFPPEMKPVHVGFYWTRYWSDGGEAWCEGWAHWDGAHWGISLGLFMDEPVLTVWTAERGNQSKFWRGLAHETPQQSLS